MAILCCLYSVDKVPLALKTAWIKSIYMLYSIDNGKQNRLQKKACIGGSMMEVYTYIEQNIDRSTKCHDDAENSDKTLLALPYPFTSPCMDGMFQEMYYWDTYFTNKGLFLLHRDQQALNNIRNMAFLLKCYGKILNGNRTSYLNRSQPPFFGCMWFFIAY